MKNTNQLLLNLSLAEGFLELLLVLLVLCQTESPIRVIGAP